MSALLANNYAFIQLLLNTTPKQQKVLLDNLTDQQTDLISEIVFNLSEVIKLSPELHQTMKKRMKTVKALSKIYQSRQRRRSEIKRHKRPLMAILEQARSNLLGMYG